MKTALIALATVVLCLRMNAMAVAQPSAALGLGEERTPSTEDAAIASLIDLQSKVAHLSGGARGQHPKAHGFLLGTFVVRDGLSAELRHGLFKEPKSYKCIIRVSNGSSSDDRQNDIHGMAIKVIGVEGEQALLGNGGKTQDFVLVDHRTFFVRDAAAMAELFAANLAVRRNPADQTLIKAWAAKHPGEFAIFVAATAKNPFPASPLAVEYGSTTPFRFGNAAAKFFVKPCGVALIDPAARSKNYLREALVERLAPATSGGTKAPVELDFAVCRQLDPEKQPVEDPTVAWETPEEVVATIVIQPQAFDVPDREAFGESLVFDPWHALAAHKPLGGINRARGKVYPVGSKIRHDLRAKSTEPTEAELDRFAR